MNCQACDQPIGASARFCGTCGATVAVRTKHFFASPPGAPAVLSRRANRFILAAIILMILPIALPFVPFLFTLIPALLLLTVSSVASICLLVVGWGLRHGAPWALRFLPEPARNQPDVLQYVWQDELCPGCAAGKDSTTRYCPACGHAYRPPAARFLEDLKFVVRRTFARQPVEPPRTQAYIRRQPHQTTDKLFIVALVVLGLGWFLAWGFFPLIFAGITLAVLVPPLVMLFWIRHQDRFEPEPWGLVLIAFAWGALTAQWVMWVNTFLGFAPLAGITEEIPKALIVLLIATHRTFRREMNGPVDGMIYGAAAGLGFEAIENFMYVLQLSTQWGFLPAYVLRSGIPFSHMMWTGITGSFMGLMMLRTGQMRLRHLFIGVIPGATLHFLNNALGFVSPTMEVYLGLFVIVTLVTAFLFFKLLAEGLRDEGFWGFGAGKAPVESND